MNINRFVSSQVTVGDINDNCPELATSTYVIHPIPVLVTGSLISLAATDADSGMNADLSYYVTEYTVE